MAAQQFNLRWNNHTNNMLQVLSDSFEKETLTDVTLSCQGKFIKAHKIVLGACSPHFQDIFDHHETPHPVIIMSGVKYEDIRAIVEFMYKGEVKITESDLESLLATAEGLQVKGLSNVRATRPGSIGTSTTNSTNSTASCSKNTTGTSDLSGNRNHNHSSEKTISHNSNVNCHNANSSISSSVPHMNSIAGGGRNQASTSSPSLLNNHANCNNNDADSHPTHRRKRAKASTNKDVNENSFLEVKPLVKRNSSNIEEENSEDGPIIKVDPSFIRDIDEGDESDDIPKDSHMESSDGLQEMKAAGMIEPKEKIPRPPNAFMIFANEWRRKLATENPNESNKEISVRLGIMWKNLPSPKKEDYFAASRQANDDHKRKYPDYYYSPKEARMRKRWKIQQQQVNQMISTGQYNPVHLVKVYMDDNDGSNHTSQSQKQPSARSNSKSSTHNAKDK